MMAMDEGTKRAADVIIESCKLIGVIIGGLWVYFRFRREDTHSPKVSFDIEANFFTTEGETGVAEFLMVINNKGLVKHQFRKVRIRVRGISRTDAIAPLKDTQRVAFPHKIVDDADVFSKSPYDSFVESGVTQKMSFIAAIPADMRYVLAHAEFEYLSGRTHSAERVFEVGTKPKSSTLGGALV